jgi:hypothetical protein
MKETPMRLFRSEYGNPSTSTVCAADGSNACQRFSWQVTAVRADMEPLEVGMVKAARAVAGAG